MSLAHAILGLLHDQPRTGYDLKTQCFDTSIAHFWPADQAQIYRTLEKMRDEGWVAFEIEQQDDRPNRKVYSLTKAGREELKRWLRETRHELAAIREPFLVQLFFAHILPDDEVLELLEDQRRQHAQRLARYEAVPLPPLGTKGVPRQYQLQRMTLDYGLAYERMALEWCDAMLAQLGARPDLVKGRRSPRSRPR